MLIKIIRWIRQQISPQKESPDDCYVTFIFAGDGKTIIKSDSRGSMYGLYIALKEGYLATVLEKELDIKPRKESKQTLLDSDNLHYPPSQFYTVIDEDKE